jgi:cation transport protein ChaC
MAARRTGHWVFGYGSLMWDPGFAFAERHPALLHGWHRAFSLSSSESWGSAERPGLVLALHPGGACRGVAYRVAPEHWPQAQAYLEQRERAYRHVEVGVRLREGAVRALTFARDPEHPRFVGKLPVAESARLIRQGEGRKGSSLSYLHGTARSIADMGYRPERLLRDLLEAIDEVA